MLWYQRSPGDTALKLIGYLHHITVNMEEQYKKDFNMSGDLSTDETKKGSLIIQVTGVKQSAVYYCAARKAQ